MKHFTQYEFYCLSEYVDELNEHGSISTLRELKKKLGYSTEEFYKRFKRKIKSRWAEEEDRLLCTIINRTDECKLSWKKICLSIPWRNAKQCRERWINNLDPNVDKSPLTRKELNILYEEFAKHGRHWRTIAKALPGRTQNFIKNYWNSNMTKCIKRKRKRSQKSSKMLPTSPEKIRKVEKIDEMPIENITEKVNNDDSFFAEDFDKEIDISD